MERHYSEPADFKVYVKGKGVVINDKTLLAYNKETNKVVAIGTEVIQVAEENQPEYEIVSAFHQGRISDYTCAEKMIKYYLAKAGMKGNLFVKPDIAICIQDNLSEVDKKAFEDAVYQAGAKQVFLCMEPFDYMIQNLEQPPMKKIKYVIGITKDEPELYIKEALSEVIESAKKQGHDKEWIRTLLEEGEV